MVQIECLCGKKFIPPKCIDTNNYEGEVVCPECKALLHIKLAKGKLQKRKVVKIRKEITFTPNDYELATRPLKEEQTDG